MTEQIDDLLTRAETLAIQAGDLDQYYRESGNNDYGKWHEVRDLILDLVAECRRLQLLDDGRLKRALTPIATELTEARAEAAKWKQDAEQLAEALRLNAPEPVLGNGYALNSPLAVARHVLAAHDALTKEGGE